MDIFFRTKKKIVKMNDKLEVEGKENDYLTTSSLNGESKDILGHYNSEARAMEILDRIEGILDKVIASDKEAAFINIESD